MKLTGTDLDRIPVTNLRVPLLEFAELWVAVEEHQDAQTARGVDDWYGAGVQATCEWIGCAVVRPLSGRRPYLAPAPVTRGEGSAYEELIHAEAIAADMLVWRTPRPAWLLARPGWAEGIHATFEWAWRASGQPPQFAENRYRAAAS
jgi:hypothetical protein